MAGESGLLDSILDWIFHVLFWIVLYLKFGRKLLGGISKDVQVYIWEEFHSRNVKLPSETNMILTFCVSIKVSSKDETCVFQPYWLNYYIHGRSGGVNSLYRLTTKHYISFLATQLHLAWLWTLQPIQNLAWEQILFWKLTLARSQKAWASDLTWKGSEIADFCSAPESRYFCDPGWPVRHSRASGPQLSNGKRNLPVLPA